MVVFRREGDGYRIQIHKPGSLHHPLLERVMSEEEMRSYSNGGKVPVMLPGAPGVTDDRVIATVKCIITGLEVHVPMSRQGYEQWRAGVPLAQAEPGMDKSSLAVLESGVSELGFAIGAGLFQPELVAEVIAQRQPFILVP